MEFTTLSSRGRIVIPKALRDARHWRAGTTFIVEEVPQGILLKPLGSLFPASLDEVMGCSGYSGPPLLQTDIDAALDADVADRHAAQ